MPGVHTFYDGSKVFEPVSEVLGIDVDKVGYKSCKEVHWARALRALVDTTT